MGYRWTGNVHTKTGKLGMLWASWGENRYAQGVAYSESGKLLDPGFRKKMHLKEIIPVMECCSQHLKANVYLLSTIPMGKDLVTAAL